MRHIILKDTRITQRQFQAWVALDIPFWEEHLGITPTYEVIDTDFSEYPTFIDTEGDVRPTNAYLQSLATPVIKKYGEFGFDFIMVLVHHENWRSAPKGKGIWGTNYSYIFGNHCLEYCRWDTRVANTFGTAYHERHHSFDALVKVETGVDVCPLLDVTTYDASITHGGKQPWKYIRYQENLESLAIMKPHLQKAFQVRKDKHDKIVKGLMETIIGLAGKVLYLLRRQSNKKNGVSDNI